MRRRLVRRRLVHLACLVALQQPGAALQGPLRRIAPTVSVTDKPLPVDTPRGDIVLAAEPAVADPAVAVEAAPATYARGLATIGGITLIFASNSPVLHAATSGDHAPPVLLLNAACAVLALAGLLVFGPLAAPLAPTAAADATRADAEAWRRGGELGLWKFLFNCRCKHSPHGAN